MPGAAPSTRTDPATGGNRPAIVFTSVDFPEPFVPSTASVAPRPTSRLSPSTTGRPPYPTASPSQATAGALTPAPAGRPGGAGTAP